MTEEVIQPLQLLGLNLTHNFQKTTNDKIMCISLLNDQITISDIKGNLKSYNINDKSCSKDYGKVFKGRIISMAGYGDNLFVSDDWGNLKQYDLKNYSEIKDYGKIHKGGIWSIVVSPNGKYLITTDDQGTVKQWSVEKKTQLKDYNRFHNGFIRVTCFTPNSEYWFLTDLSGNLKQYKVNERSLELEKDYGKVHKGGIRSIVCTHDGEYLFTSEYNGYLKQWKIDSRTQVKNYGQQHLECITSLNITADSKYLYTADESGVIKQVLISSQRCIKNYGKLMQSGIQSMAINENSQFTSSTDGKLMQFDVNHPIEEDIEMVKEEITQQSIADILAALKQGKFKSKNNFLSQIPEGEEENYIKDHWELFKSGAFKPKSVRNMGDPSISSYENNLKSRGGTEVQTDEVNFDIIESQLIQGYFDKITTDFPTTVHTELKTTKEAKVIGSVRPETEVKKGAQEKTDESDSNNKNEENPKIVFNPVNTQEDVNMLKSIDKKQVTQTVKNVLNISQEKILQEQIKQLNGKFDKVDDLGREVMEIEMKIEKMEFKVDYLEKQDEKKENLGGFKELYEKVNQLEQGVINNRENLADSDNIGNQTQTQNNLGLGVNINRNFYGDSRYLFKYKYGADKEQDFVLSNRVEKLEGKVDKINDKVGRIEADIIKLLDVLTNKSK